MHRLLILGVGVLVVVSCVLAGAAWRLAQGPIELGWLANRVKAAFIDDASPVRVSFDGAFLVWEGFHKGVDYPLDVRLTNLAITDLTGGMLAKAPSAHATFSPAGLLLGRFVPRTIEVDHARIAVTREANGAIVGLGGRLIGDNSAAPGGNDLRLFRDQLARAASSDHGRSWGLLDQLRRVHFRDTEVTFRERDTGLILRTSAMDLDLSRAGTGHVQALLVAPLQGGDQHSTLKAHAVWAVGSALRLDMTLSSFRPSHMGALPPGAAFLTGIDLPASMTATAWFGRSLMFDRIEADVTLDQGGIQIAQGKVPVRSGTFSLSATSDAMTISKGHFDVAHTPDSRPEIVEIAGSVAHKADRLSATVTVGLDQIDIADLPLLWPPGVGGGARPWVVEHVTGGMATRGRASFVIEADDALRDVVVTRASGDLYASNATFTWIDHVPPVVQTEAHLHLVDPDTLDIDVSSAHQRIPNGGADLVLQDGQMRITGLSLRDQIAVIRTQVEGPVASAITLLKEPRLHLLSTHPIGIAIGGGDASATLDFQFPLENKLQIDDVQIHADAHLTGVRLPDVAVGETLEDGVFDLGVDKDGLTLKGQGSVATIPVALDGTMTFNPGPPDQIVQKIVATGRPTVAQLELAGLQVADYLGGPIPLTMVLTERRDGRGSVAINGDLTTATLSVGSLAWHKPSGSAASASLVLLMSHDQPTKIDAITVRGDGLLLTGGAGFVDGRVRSVVLDDIQLGRTHGRGRVQLAPHGPIDIALQGDQLDLSAKLTEKLGGSAKPDKAQVTTPAWTFAARFDHAILANGENTRDLLVTAAGGGSLIRFLDASGTNTAGVGFSVKIEPGAGKRHLLVETADAGGFLRGLDAIRGAQSGRLTIDGVFDEPFGLHPLTGTATIDNVVIKNSPVLGKLLQAITVYGLVAALSGPGMGFTHIVVPFNYDGNDLNVVAAHASNASLGLTANGRIGVSSGQIAMSGTLVPAYFFNSMLGQLPLVGKLFSPEKGGGVFAARFGLTGRTDDPNVSINPISALTPGFLRGIFGVFDRPPAAKSSPADGK